MDGKENTKITKEEYKIKDVFNENSKIDINEIIKESFLLSLRDCKM